MRVFYRRASDADLRSICRLEAGSFDHDAWPKPVFEGYLSSFPELFLIARVNGRMAGYCLGRLTRCSGEIDSIAVSRRHRRHGIATSLLKRLITIFRRRKCEFVRLTVRPDNTGAVALYQKCGFVRTESIQNYYENGSRGWRMRLRLSNHSDRI